MMISNGILLEKGMPGVALAVTASAVGLGALGFRAWIGKSKKAVVKLADKLQGVVSEHVADDVRRNLERQTPQGDAREAEVVDRNRLG